MLSFIIHSLLNKGIIREAGFVRCSKTYGRTFEATMTREEYFAANVFSHRYKPEVAGLFEALLNRPEITETDLDRIGKLVAEKIG